MHRIFATLLIGLMPMSFAANMDAPPAAEPEREQVAPGMTVERLTAIIALIDEDLRVEGNVVEFAVEGYALVMVFDVAANRMRLMSPIAKTEELPEGELLRLMQANFDSALDARYAIAQGALWGLFVHPLSELSEEQFVTAIGQTVNVVATFGDGYSSGVFMFGGGDSGAIERRKLIDSLREKIKT
ncbi:MAG: type III secretion system chaperone [Gammaproteobacteria bacterium]